MPEYEVGAVYDWPGIDGRFMYLGGDPDSTSAWKRVGVFERPAGRSPVVDDAVESFRSRTSPARVGGLLREVAQGLTSGWADEVEAAVRPDKTLEQISAERQRYRESGGPVLMPQLLGASVPGAIVGKVVGGAIRGGGIARTLGLLGATGAAEGAVTGAGTAEPGQRKRGAASGAGLGAVGGVALPGALAIGSGASDVVGSVLRPNTERIALEGLVDALSPRLGVGQRFSDIAPKAGDVAADVLGVEGRIAGSSVLRDRPENMGSVLRSLGDRQRAIPGRASTALDTFTSTPAGRSRIQRAEELARARQTRNSKAYEDLYGQAVVPRDFVDIVGEIARDDVGRRAIAAVRATLRLPKDAPVSAEFLDRLERELSDVVAGAYRGGTTPGPVRAFRDQLRDRLRDRLPGYAEAKAADATARRAERAIKDAAQWKSLSAADIEYKLAQLDADAATEFRIAVAADMEKEFVGKVAEKPRSAFTWVAAQRRKLNKLFGEDATDRFLAEMGHLSEQTETFLEARGAQKSAARRGVERDDISTKIATMVGYALNRMFGASLRTGIQSAARSPRVQRDVSTHAARLLYQQNPADAFRALDDVMPFLRGQQADRAATSGFLSYLGGQIGGH